jgi:hypothetical protein
MILCLICFLSHFSYDACSLFWCHNTTFHYSIRTILINSFFVVKGCPQQSNDEFSTCISLFSSWLLFWQLIFIVNYYCKKKMINLLLMVFLIILFHQSSLLNLVKSMIRVSNWTCFYFYCEFFANLFIIIVFFIQVI